MATFERREAIGAEALTAEKLCLALAATTRGGLVAGGQPALLEVQMNDQGWRMCVIKNDTDVCKQFFRKNTRNWAKRATLRDQGIAVWLKWLRESGSLPHRY